MCELTCLSFNPSSNTSSMSVSFGCLLRSALSLMSLGSKAILCPFSLLSYEVSGPLVSREAPGLGTGEATRLDSPSSLSAPPLPPPPPRLRVSPDDIVRSSDVNLCNCMFEILGKGGIPPQRHADKTGSRIAMHKRDVAGFLDRLQARR